MDDGGICFAQTVQQEEYEMESAYKELRLLNVNDKTEKKGNLTYLSWAWAVDQLLQSDPSATWEYRWISDRPYCLIGETAMIFCTVKAFGVERTAQLPIMDHKNKPIPNPDSFAVNTAMQRCLAKAIALHGIGLYIYAGEDLPEGGISREKMDELRRITDSILIAFGADNRADMYGEWERVKDNDEKLVVWNWLRPHSKVRSAIKEMATLAKAEPIEEAA
jgi:hypothetical protein